jgi:hypothetical protein
MELHIAHRTTFQQLQALVHQFEPRAVITLYQQYIAIVASLADGRPMDSVVKSVEALANRLRELDPALEAAFAVCEPVDDLSLLSSAFHEGRLSLVARRQLGLAPRVSAIRELRAYRLLLRGATDADVLELCTRTLAPVRSTSSSTVAPCWPPTAPTSPTTRARRRRRVRWECTRTPSCTASTGFSR